MLYQIGQTDSAIEAMTAFLAATENLIGPGWPKVRQSAATVVKLTRGQTKPAEKPAPAPTPPPPPPPTPTPAPPPAAAPDTPRETPRVNVQFFPVAAPAFETPGTVADYFLRRRWMNCGWRNASKTCSACRRSRAWTPTCYQQETVRRVLRHFKGRALLADEVGLGKTIEACLILKEYWIRGLVHKALVLTPPSLVSQWKGELAEKFGLDSRLARYRGVPPRPRAILERRAAGGGLHRHGAHGCRTPPPLPPCPGTW